jgi:hypothetical protein
VRFSERRVKVDVIPPGPELYRIEFGSIVFCVNKDQLSDFRDALNGVLAGERSA